MGRVSDYAIRESKGSLALMVTGSSDEGRNLALEMG